jgi:hypothetical protein
VAPGLDSEISPLGCVADELVRSGVLANVVDVEEHRESHLEDGVEANQRDRRGDTERPPATGKHCRAPSILDRKVGDDVAEERVGKKAQAVEGVLGPAGLLCLRHDATARVWIPREDARGAGDGFAEARHQPGGAIGLGAGHCGLGTGLIGGDSIAITAGELRVEDDVEVGGDGVRSRSGLVDDIGQRDGDVGGEAELVADLHGGDGDVVPFEETSRVVSHHWCVCIRGDGVVVSTEQTAPVIGNDGSSNVRSLGRSGNDPRGLGRGLGVGEAALPPSVEVIEQLVQSVENELGVERTHGDAENRPALIRIVSSTHLLNDRTGITSTPINQHQ